MRNPDREAILKEKGFLTDRPRLSEVPYEEIQVGGRVFSGFTGAYGFVQDKINLLDLNDPKYEDNHIVVFWDKGTKSIQYQRDYDGVEYLGHK